MYLEKFQFIYILMRKSWRKKIIFFSYYFFSFSFRETEEKFSCFNFSFLSFFQLASVGLQWPFKVLGVTVCVTSCGVTLKLFMIHLSVCRFGSLLPGWACRKCFFFLELWSGKKVMINVWIFFFVLLLLSLLFFLKHTICSFWKENLFFFGLLKFLCSLFRELTSAETVNLIFPLVKHNFFVMRAVFRGFECKCGDNLGSFTK